MSQVVYLYGFVPASSPTPGSELTGLEDGPVEVVQLDGFAAAIGRLPASGYGEEALEERVADLRWMAHRGVLHERVVTWFVDRDGIVPARFLTLHRTEASLRDEALGRGERIRSLLARFEGRREWDLKITFDETVLLDRMGEESEAVLALDREIEAASPGRRYLLERRRHDLARARVEEVGGRLAADLLGALGEHAEELKRLPVARAEGPGRVIVHAALLVHRSREDALEAGVDEGAHALAERGLGVELSGPWAPYRFIEERSTAEGEVAG